MLSLALVVLKDKLAVLNPGLGLESGPWSWVLALALRVWSLASWPWVLGPGLQSLVLGLESLVLALALRVWSLVLNPWFWPWESGPWPWILGPCLGLQSLVLGPWPWILGPGLESLVHGLESLVLALALRVWSLALNPWSWPWRLVLVWGQCWPSYYKK